MHDKWRPKSWYGEDTGGLALLKEKIVDVSKTTYGHWPYIVWKTPDNSENAKRGRIKGLELLLNAKRLFFLTGPWNSETFEQLERYKGQKSTRYFKDDVPDVLSQLTSFIPSLVRLSKKELLEQANQKDAEYREFIRREQRKIIFGDDNGGFGMSQPEYYSSWAGNEPTEEPSSPVGGIARKLFGGNGLRA
jgi:hypothetical protein